MQINELCIPISCQWMSIWRTKSWKSCQKSRTKALVVFFTAFLLGWWKNIAKMFWK